jgi:hypothetical protein
MIVPSGMDMQVFAQAPASIRETPLMPNPVSIEPSGFTRTATMFPA